MTTTGVVTGRKTNGFFVQTTDAEADADPATSQAVFVFTAGAPAVTAGDGMSVRGTASEFFSLTQLESTLPGDVAVTSSANPLPLPVLLTPVILNPAGAPDQLERFEGMRLHAATLVSVAPTNEFGETFTVLGGVARPMREPGIEISQPVPPDPTTGAPDCCIPRWDENPERLLIEPGGLTGTARIAVTSNTSLANVTGPLDFAFGDYKVLPETAPVVTGGMAAVPVPAPTASGFTVAGYNIEFFNNDPTQRRKVALAIRNVLHYPDVIGHIEIASLASLEALATQVNDDAIAAGESSPGYVARLITAPGGTQHLGFLVKTTRVRIDNVTQERATETYINPVNGQPETLHDRPPLVLRATVDPTSDAPRAVIVVLNHPRSFIDIELVTGDGVRVRAKRTAQAESLASLLQELQTGSPATPVISIGDYNAYEFNDGYTDPISIIKGQPTADDQIVVDESPDLVTPNFVNLTDELPAGERYSFIFEGTPQALDHVLVNSVARSYLRSYAIARNNSDFPEAPAALFAGDPNRPERNSDHDMPIAYFDLTAPAIAGLTATPGNLGSPNHKMIDVALDYSATDDSGPVSCSVGVSSNEPADAQGDGHTSIDWEVIDVHHVRLRAERSGKGTGRVYTVTVTCSDATGNISSSSVPVGVSR